MEVRRTVPVKLDVADSDADLLHQTISEFLWAANYVVDQAWQGEYKTTSKAELQRETYDDVRAETRLQANLVQNARNKAADAVQSVVARWKQGDYAGKPQFTASTLVYDKRCATFNDDHATLSTVEDRITAEYVLPDASRETPHSEYLFNDDYELTGAELHYRDGEFYLHVRTKADVESETADDGNTEHSTVLGVDLGIENVAVTSTGRFWTGSELNHWHREFEKRRGSLQQRGTRAAHETIQSVGRTETGRYDHFFHTVSKELVAEAVEHDCDVIAFENLTGIRERMPNAKKFHAWAFRRLFEYVEYKAEIVDISVEQVSPAYTSQRCSKCGTTLRENRQAQERFCCQKCGYEVNADYNAAKNIGVKYLRSTQTSSGGGAPVNVRLNRGTLNVNGDYEPASDGQNGSPRESPARNEANGEAVSE
ncbi:MULTISPECIES: RNA-guided endonuclease TnpB family protein [Halorubrum]|uniref:RNA-guided endonuclease InsQ/TnpB family protein n=1 Tax=Halorubrum TaxID=56688 RepID=UPI0006775C07|nr:MULTISPECIES: RNA-guided endonuclease TnpB family protein [Halorubrum]TKX65664.1 transposase [Halorubrum sp. GN11GM_10-3_MGM]